MGNHWRGRRLYRSRPALMPRSFGKRRNNATSKSNTTQEHQGHHGPCAHAKDCGGVVPLAEVCDAQCTPGSNRSQAHLPAAVQQFQKTVSFSFHRGLAFHFCHKAPIVRALDR